MQDAALKTLPPLRPELRLFPGTRTADGAPTWVVYDPVKYRYFNIGRMEFELLRRWGECSPADLLARVNSETSVRAGADALERLLAFLDRQELLRAAGPEAVRKFTRLAALLRRSVWGQLLHKYLFFRIPLVRPDRFLSATLPWLRPFLHPVFAYVLAGLGLLGLYLVSRQWESFVGTLPYLFSLPGLVAFAVALSLAKVAHELGHAYTAKYYGLEVPTMGVAFLVMWPVLYTDTSNAWRLTSRRQRLWIGAAGMGVELALAVLATFLWNFLPDGPVRSAVFMVAAVTWIMTLLINLSPFMRFDGYYLLSDILGVNNLQDRSFTLARWWLREQVLGLGDAMPEYFPPRRRGILLAYAFSTWLYRFFLFLGIALLVYFFFFKVLGIFLMLVELVWFIARPVYQELAYWWTRRHDMRLNRHTVASLIALGAGLAGLALPWQSTVHVPAVYRTQSEQRIYAPFPGQIQEIGIRRGQSVKTGDTLFVLADPETRYKLESAQRQKELLELQLALQSADRVFLDRSKVLQNQLAETQAKIVGYQEQQARLRITAPADGVIVDLDDTLREGRWVAPSTLLALLIDPRRTRVTAYFDESEVNRVGVGDSGRFYADIPEVPPLDVVVEAIEPANIPHLQATDYYIASAYAGAVPVRQGGERFTPEHAIYRVRLAPADGREIPRQVLRGEVALASAERKSLLARAWTWTGAVLVRESGF